MDIGPVDLDDENDFSECRVVAHRRVRTHDLYLFAGFRVGFEISKGNMLAGGQAENRFRSGQSEDKFGGIMRQDRFADERKGFEVVHWQDGLLSVRQENEAQHKGHDGHNAGKEYIIVCKHGCWMILLFEDRFNGAKYMKQLVEVWKTTCLKAMLKLKSDKNRMKTKNKMLEF